MKLKYSINVRHRAKNYLAPTVGNGQEEKTAEYAI